MDNIIDFVKEHLPLNKTDEEKLDFIREFIENYEFKIVEKLLKIGRLDISRAVMKTPFAESKPFPIIKFNKKIISQILKKDLLLIDEINDKIKQNIEERLFVESSRKIKFEDYIAPSIKGLDSIKKAVSLQLFSSEPVHILLLGDPGTGKTEILRNIEKIHPKSVFGLGSGTSGVGLSASFKEGKISEGLLPRANDGICCIDELNLMKEEDMASLYGAMEKGFITYDKGGHHLKLDAKIRVLATANPSKDKFTAKDLAGLKSQIPFDSALLTRFHLVYLIKKPSINAFLEITKKILSTKKDAVIPSSVYLFLQKYVLAAEQIDVSLSAKYQNSITKYIGQLKKDEDKYLVEISPRTVIGIARLAKASARKNFRNSVNEDDIEIAKEVFSSTLEFL